MEKTTPQLDGSPKPTGPTKETSWVSQVILMRVSFIFFIISVDENLRSYAVTNIVFEGLDTFARVLINDMEVGRSENMFVRYIFDVKQLLQVAIVLLFCVCINNWEFYFSGWLQ